MGRLKQTWTVAHCAGESAFDVSEQFGFQQLFGNRAAINGYKGCVGTVAGAMDRLRQQFLAAAAFAANQDAGVGCGDQLGLGQQRVHALAAADQTGAPCFIVGR